MRGARLRSAAATGSSSGSRRLQLAASRPWHGARRRAAHAQARTAGRARALHVSALLDYVASVSDDGVLKLPARTELDPEEIKTVFGYPRCVTEPKRRMPPAAA